MTTAEILSNSADTLGYPRFGLGAGERPLLDACSCIHLVDCTEQFGDLRVWKVVTPAALEHIFVFSAASYEKPSFARKLSLLNAVSTNASGSITEVLSDVDAEICRIVGAWNSGIDLNQESSDLALRLSLCSQNATAPLSQYETMRNTLALLWELLALNTEQQEMIRQEILAHIPLEGTPTKDELGNLPLTSEFVANIIDLSPRMFSFARMAIQDDIIMGQPVRTGDLFFITPQALANTEWLSGNISRPAIELKLVIARVLSRFEVLQSNGLSRLVPLERTEYIEGYIAGQHKLLDRCFEIRNDVFVKNLKWPLKVDVQGRECDQFDTSHTGYFAVLRNGKLAATARVLPAELPSLLYDVFPHLIADPEARNPRKGTWEGARLAVAPEMSANESTAICARLLGDAIATAMGRNIDLMYTVSDPVLERVLIRVGVAPQRLGPVVVDKYGFAALALKITCNAEILASCRAAEKKYIERQRQKQTVLTQAA